jgi:ferredoxin
MLWTDLGDRYLVESLTGKGSAILEAGGDLFTAASEADVAAGKDVVRAAEERIFRTIRREGITDALERAFGSDYWDEFSRRCVGCGVCTLLCPTCHCFDINDVTTMGRSWRERTWDSCQTEYYTLHASGHNPRPVKSFRQRNRIYHKFLYMEKNLDVTGCVGCGRCISGCPVNIDIIEIIDGVRTDVVDRETGTGAGTRDPAKGEVTG